MEIGDKIKILNEAALDKKTSRFPELKDKIKLGHVYEISKIWEAIPEKLYGLDPDPDFGFTESELALMQLPVHYEPLPKHLKNFESFKDSNQK